MACGVWRVTCGVLQVDKLQFVLYIKDIPTVEGRNAELALWRRCPEEAEKILVQVGSSTMLLLLLLLLLPFVVLVMMVIPTTFLQAGLFYRAVRMHLRLYNWER